MEPIVIEPRRKKVAIVGFAKPHRMEAPFGHPEWEVWPVNDAWGFMPPNTATRWFELHAPWIYEWELRRAHGHLDYLRAFGEAGGIVYTLAETPTLPRAVPFPFEAVCDTLWPGWREAVRAEVPAYRVNVPYLTSSIAYMLALAIAEGFETIGVWGVDMAAESEYSDQRPACEYLIGLAQGRGCEVILPTSCRLMKGPLYGRGWINPGGERITTTQLQARLKDLQKGEHQVISSCDQTLSLINQIQGAMKSNRDLIGVLPEQAPMFKARIDDLESQLNAAQQQHGHNMQQLNLVRGAISETLRWIGITPEGGDPRNLPTVESVALPTASRSQAAPTLSVVDVPPPYQGEFPPNGAASEALEVTA